MANYSVKDYGGSQVYFTTASGSGSSGDPFVHTCQITGTVTVGSHAVTNAGTFAVQAAQSGTWNITNVSGTISLPTGAATAANQSTIIASAASIDGKITACNTGAVVLAAGTAAFGKLAANSGVTIGAVEIASSQTLSTVTTVTTLTTCSTLTGGGVAHDGVDSGNPHKIGAKATASILGATPVAAADRTDLYAGLDGVLINRPHSSLEDIISEVKTNTDGSSTAMTGGFAATASQRIYLTSLIIANSSSTNITVDIRDGSGGSVLATFPVPANGGCIHAFPVPLRFSANTAAAFDPSAAASTVSVTMVGFKSKQ